MKRRKFLIGTTAGSLASVTLPTGRLFGKPNSLNNRTESNIKLDAFKLPLARANLPVDLWEEISQFSFLCNNLINDNFAANKFIENPREYCISQGIDLDQFDSNGVEIKLLKAISSPEIKNSKNYTEVLIKLQELGLIGQGGYDEMKFKLKGILKSELANFKQEFGSLDELYDKVKFSFIDNGKPTAVTLHEIMEFVEKNNITNMPGAIVVVVIAVVAIGIAVIAGVALAVGAAVGAAAAAALAVAIGTSVAVVTDVTVLTETSVDVEGEEEENLIDQKRNKLGFTKPRLAMLSNQEIDKFDLAYRVGLVSNNTKLIIDAEKDIIRNEIRAFFDAAIELDLVELTGELYDTLLDATSEYSFKSAGLV